jgi:hypothetical protein
MRGDPRPRAGHVAHFHPSGLQGWMRMPRDARDNGVALRAARARAHGRMDVSVASRFRLPSVLYAGTRATFFRRTDRPRLRLLE